MKPLPPAEVLNLSLIYDPLTGILLWRNTLASFGWHDPRGYLIGSFGGEEYFAHRLIYKMMTGQDPEIVDHMNGETADNRWANFRNVTVAVNNKNRRSRKPNPSGHRGVSIEPNGRYRAHICVNQKRITLGRFRDIACAIAARRSAEREHGFHPNHGRIDL